MKIATSGSNPLGQTGQMISVYGALFALVNKET